MEFKIFSQIQLKTTKDGFFVINAKNFVVHDLSRDIELEGRDLATIACSYIALR